MESRKTKKKKANINNEKIDRKKGIEVQRVKFFTKTREIGGLIGEEGTEWKEYVKEDSPKNYAVRRKIGLKEGVAVRGDSMNELKGFSKKKKYIFR